MRARLFAVLMAWSALGATAQASAAPPSLHTDRFRVVYEVPKNPEHQALYDELRSARTLEKFREFLSFLRLPRILTLKLAGCDGDENAWYDPEDLTITVCYEYLAQARKAAPASVTPEGLTPRAAVLGPLLEVFLHEVGHALFDQLHIPILGREEDAADQFAAFILLHLDRQTARDTMLGVAWMLGQEAKDGEITRDSLADVHGLAGQRFYGELCMAYGAEPTLFQDLVDRKYLPQERAEGCAEEYGQVAYAVKTLMGRYIDASTRDKVFAGKWLGGKLRGKTAGDTVPQ